MIPAKRKLPLGAVTIFGSIACTILMGVNLSTSHAAMAAPAYGQILVAGGAGIGGTLGNAELYNPGSNSFAGTAPAMNAARQYQTAVLITLGPNAGKVLIAGGLGNSTLASTELYDPATNTSAVAPT